MPTGYTAALYDGPQTFPEYLWRCARGVGYLFFLRDEPLDAPLPEQLETPDAKYHREQLQCAEQSLVRARAVSMESLLKQAQLAHEEALLAHSKTIQERARRRERYLNMLYQAQAWEVPSPEHQGLKDLMIQQLEDSLKWDCSVYEIPKPPLLDDVRQAALDKAQRDVDYHRQELEKAEKRTADANEWLHLLRQSVPPPKNGKKR